MLAKQGWKIIQQPHSVMARVLNSKYFPNQTFMEASAYENPSWGWRSIMEGKKVLLKGMRWQVRCGNQINCQQDPWINSTYPFKPRLKEGNWSQFVTVRHLINTETTTWNVPAIQSVFVKADADTILNTPFKQNESPKQIDMVSHQTWSLHSKIGLPYSNTNLSRRPGHFKLQQSS